MHSRPAMSGFADGIEDSMNALKTEWVVLEWGGTLGGVGVIVLPLIWPQVVGGSKA